MCGKGGACVVKGGMCGKGGSMCGKGGMHGEGGGCVPCTPPGHHKIQSVNARPVRILLEYILVLLEKLEYNDGGGNSD